MLINKNDLQFQKYGRFPSFLDFNFESFSCSLLPLLPSIRQHATLKHYKSTLLPPNVTALIPTNKTNIDNTVPTILSSEDTSTSSSLDLLLSNAADELGLHHDRSVNAASAEELEHSVGLEVDHGRLGGVLHSLLLSLLREQMPQLVHIDGGAVLRVTLQVEVSHTDLSEVSRVARFEQ